MKPSEAARDGGGPRPVKAGPVLRQVKQTVKVRGSYVSLVRAGERPRVKRATRYVIPGLFNPPSESRHERAMRNVRAYDKG
jgi:hypothetical protein